jgi:hypothetical protein
MLRVRKKKYRAKQKKIKLRRASYRGQAGVEKYASHKK